ncbi:MAG: DNA-binding protein WhiA [Bacilli bacterium]|nr:DNA-binding protein WhiA [Bacilli bacterium]
MLKRSFSLHVKEELCHNTYESLAVRKALLSAYIRINGNIVIRNKHSLLTMSNENAKIIKFIYSLILDIYPSNVSLSFTKKGKTKTIYTINVSNNVDEILEELDVNFLEGKISKEIVYDDETISGYLVGAFLACGSINSPETSNYHLELAVNSENYAKWLSHLFLRYKNNKIEPRIIKRRNKYVLYFKKGDQIADFLVMIGAMGSAMDFENYRIDRDYMNNANRLTNLDTANMSKTIEAGKRQAHEIRYLIKHIGLEAIGNKKTQLVASIRNERISVSLDEIASMVSKELKEEVSKSNINHIFRKIHELYLKEKK